jgi:ribosomal protein L11 methyltransferase
MAWQRVGLLVAGAHAQALCDALEEAGALSTEISDANAGTGEERAVFGEPGADVMLWERCYVGGLFNLGFDVPGALHTALAESGAQPLEQPVFDRIEDADWVALTQRQFEPIRVAQRLWIVPTWHHAPDPDAINVILDPGAAFGTGSHPTTRLCLGWLEDNVRGGETLLDYGCGSGILAIAAMKLGASRAWAVDVDPLALEATRYNSSQNDVVLEVFDAQQPLPGEAQVTVANILANPLRMLAPLLSTHTQAGGLIALSGILDIQADSVRDAYAPWVDLAIHENDGGWVLMTGRRRA